MTRPRLLDLFCKAGGCAVGYAAAGFDVDGVDIEPQRHWPKHFPGIKQFKQADALEYAEKYGRFYDVIHASPPCQRYSVATKDRERHPDLLPTVRDLLVRIGQPWIIENVEGAPIRSPAIRLCGLMFGLTLFRHRWFESSRLLLAPPHAPHSGRRIGVGGFCTVAGGGNSGLRDRREGRMIRRRPEDGVGAWRKAMDIDWMTRDELAQAIPPAYTEFVGRQLMRQLEATRAA